MNYNYVNIIIVIAIIIVHYYNYIIIIDESRVARITNERRDARFCTVERDFFSTQCRGINYRN